MRRSHWLLLERTEHLLSELYRQGGAPDPIRLFDGTELASCEEESPLLINAQANPSLLAAMQNQPFDWPGLQLENTGSLDDLLAHLRQILFIRFDEQRRGVLRYSRPRTASYFFPACSDETLPVWLGPIHSLSWYGGTWRDSADGHDAWQRLVNHQASVWCPNTTTHELHLDAHQEEALKRQQGEHFLYQWWARQRGIRFETAWNYLTDGMQSGFASAELLSVYLDLRNANPHVTPPAELPAGSDKERLHALAQHMATSPTDKESTA